MRVIIPSRNAANLQACVAAVLRADEGRIKPDDIIVIDDGAHVHWAPDAPGVTWIEGVKPFVYARAVNQGIEAAGRDGNIVVMGDDALITAGRLTYLEEAALHAPVPLGACSAGVIRGLVCNPNQRPRICYCDAVPDAHTHSYVRPEHNMVAFVCVWISRAALDAVGPLDERFTGYGYDDTDYCRRIRDAGLFLGVSDSCLVDHGTLPSEYRSGNYEWVTKMQENGERYTEKWGESREPGVAKSRK